MTYNFKYGEQKSSRGKIVLLAFFLLLVAGAGFALYAYNKIHRPLNSDSSEVIFSVPKGASTGEVAALLEEKNLIDSKFIFTAYARFSGGTAKVQAGDYLLNQKMSMVEILDSLTSGKVTRNEKRVVIREGSNNKQVSQLLQDAGLVTAGQFEDALGEDYDFDFASAAKKFKYEGFLFPDTYTFDANLDAEDIIQRMLNNFENKVTNEMRAELERKNQSIEEAIILASIIEREVGRRSDVTLTEEVLDKMQSERETVASIFYNRLEIDMPLQSDATVNYATGKSDRRALLSDLEVDSPYNTYKYAGLPPGPISNPGINSIRAAIFPADTDYLYFLNNQEGTAYFGRTLQEHNQNRSRYLD